MILTGILEQSLGSFTCLRGYANLKELAKISQANDTYQRELNEQHIKEIQAYYSLGEYLFFPEIILGYTLKNDDGISLAMNAPFLEMDKQKNKSSALKISQVNPSRKAFSGLNLTSIEIKEPQKIFFRIDGNHRLDAIENLDKDYKAPFCLIFFSGEDTEDTVNEYRPANAKLPANAKQQRVLFHYINSRGLPLTSEENLTAIFSKNQFTNDEIEQTFGKAYLLAKHLYESIDKDTISEIEQFCETKKCYASFFLQLCKLLIALSDQNAEIVKNIKKGLSRVNTYLAENEDIKNNLSENLLAAISFLGIKEDGIALQQFIRWITNKKLYEVKDIDTQSFIDVFEKAYKTELKIFVAMPYYDKNTVADYNKALQEISKSIIKDYKLNITPYPIMTNSGTSMDLIQDIFRKIEECSIFIADITNNNANVLYELGFAKGKGKDCILILNEDKQIPEEKIKSDYQNELRHHFKGYDSLNTTLETNILAILRDRGYI
ncbi:hypothetical protein [Mannheimia indoligenes]|uniref:hypothetical protein n=1 Tax=Mannheimia indoligenes TaxID=3103145 RepID=UPI002FE596DD